MCVRVCVYESFRRDPIHFKLLPPCTRGAWEHLPPPVRPPATHTPRTPTHPTHPPPTHPHTPTRTPTPLTGLVRINAHSHPHPNVLRSFSLVLV